MEQIDKILLEKMIEQRYVNRGKHPLAELYIYNYSQTTQFERKWNEVTLACRGLIMDQDNNIVARPFPKFFNYGEYEDQVIPDESFDVYEKMDGSLGISYLLDGEIKIATRGSFQSNQANEATAMLYTKYTEAIPKMNPCCTYLFEIIYPENRIVVDYGDEKMLVLLAVIDIALGIEQPLEDIGFPLVKKYDGVQDIKSLVALNTENKEGFVLKFKNGYRIKVKFEEYVRIHRIISHVSSISIWEYLRSGSSIEEILDRVPDEFFQWVKDQKQLLQEQYKAIEEIAKQEFKILEDRKTTALYFMQCKYPTVLFSMLDKREYSDIIWKMIRPMHSKPFVNLVE
jgi:T4 RnlA family RNA ligase